MNTYASMSDDDELSEYTFHDTEIFCKVIHLLSDKNLVIFYHSFTIYKYDDKRLSYLTSFKNTMDTESYKSLHNAFIYKVLVENPLEHIKHEMVLRFTQQHSV